MDTEFGVVRYPICFREEDSLAARKQQRHRTTLLIVGVIAVFLEALSWFSDFLGSSVWHLVPRVLFTAAIAFLGWELLAANSKRLEISWYEARAAAESLKTVYWRYIMRAEPFEAVMSRLESENMLMQRIEDVLIGLGKTPKLRASLIEIEVLEWSWSVRTSGLEQRVNLYVRERVEDQSRWYETKARVLSKHARRASTVAISATVMAFALSVAGFWVDSAGGWSEVSFELSVVIFGYAAIRNYRRDSRVYEFTRQEIEVAASQIHPDLTHGEWAQLVDEIEEVFSREHVTWQASHSGEVRQSMVDRGEHLGS